ncbi:hypothetical protein BX600DRAFT_443127 [Xylariales sp. PMI_506]|nr:hypothetical protein BX600DRAFT_443127 [Xylariales sp. PMI_506]
MANPNEVGKHSPTLSRLLKSRLAPSREKTLLNAALGDEKPVKPAAGDCCGSSCNPCVMDLYREELKVWKECADYRKLVSTTTETDSASTPESGHLPLTTTTTTTTRTSDEKAFVKMPGTYEW